VKALYSANIFGGFTLKPEQCLLLGSVFSFMLFLAIIAPIFSYGGKAEEPLLNDAKNNMGGGNLVQPVVYHPDRIDKNFNGLQDSLENLISRANHGSSLPVVVTLYNPVSSQDLNHFGVLGGHVSYVYKYVAFGFAGVIPAISILEFARLEGANLAIIEYDAPLQYHLDYSVAQTRARPIVWDTYGYNGSSSQSIAILDTGIDDSHIDLGPYGDLDFTSKIVGWYDATSDGALTPEDYGEHGSHVAGIAAGSGMANSLQGSGTIKTTFTYTLPSAGYGYIDYLDVKNPGIIGLDCSWSGNNRVLLRLYDPSGVNVAETSGTSKPLLLNYDTSETTYPTGRYRVLVGNLAGAKGNPFSVVETYPYEGRNDEHNLFVGVAPNARLVGVKVFNNAGSGTISTVMAGMDWVIQNRLSYHIVVASMSLSLENGVVDTTLDQKADTMVKNGIVTTVSAGNNYPDYTIGSPGTAAYVITVAATNDQDGITDYSSNGNQAKNEYGLIKPDVAAPGGTFQSQFGNKIVSTDSNDVDAQVGFADRNVNDYQQMAGTSMSAPHVAGLAALIVQAMDSWSWSQADALKVKMLISMTASETQSGESSNAPPLNRGDKDSKEGYGRINADAAIEATTMSYDLGQIVTEGLGPNPLDKKVWARKVSLQTGYRYTFSLSVPSGADYDLYLYQSTPDQYGQPIIVSKSTSASNLIETIEYTPSVAGTYYIVVKWVSGTGTFDVQGIGESLHDVSVLSVVPATSAVYVGRLVNVAVKVANRGTVNETFDVRALFNGSEMGTQTVTDLLPNTNVTLTFVWNTTNLSLGYYVISAIAGPVLEETKVSDNTLSDGTVQAKTLGDINGDWSVNIFDAIILSTAYGSSVGEPEYQPNADLNYDELINLFDAIILSSNWTG